jgi:methyl-accepting chemotaxis protein
VWQAVIVLFFITIFMMWLIRKATKPIDVFQKGLELFFRYINKETTEVGYIDGYSNDEIGELVESVNKNIDATVAGVKEDEKVIAEAKEVCKKASLGIFDVQITATAHSHELNDLKNLVNQLISAVGYNINRVSGVLNSYDKNDYTDRINSSGKTQGSMKEIFDKVDALGNSLTQNARTNLNNGIVLDKDTDILEDAIVKIESSLVQQSNDLDISVEELSNMAKDIVQTSTNSKSMAEYAKNVTASVEVGQNLANKTNNEMDAIATQVLSINESITIVDQISFQTNILSLNAAVEAATAGEAGKGFAVVAQEVRNLANKSAEAANEIKALVELATQKAKEGKNISTQMQEGYSALNEQISATIELIQKVSTASQNQKTTVESITQKMTVIKDDTKNSAMMIEDVKAIAHKTNDLAKTIYNDAKDKKI